LFDRFWRRQEAGEALPTATWHPTVDIAEREDAFEVKADLPGVNRDDVKVKITNNVLTLSGERESENKEGANGENYHRFERSYGSFVRSFSLPSAVDEGKIKAEFKDGVLTVTLPKSEAALPKEIKVN
jgi:HSP20 family protein